MAFLHSPAGKKLQESWLRYRETYVELKGVGCLGGCGSGSGFRALGLELLLYFLGCSP